MNTAPLMPTVDWSNELLHSIRWILQTFAITAPCLLVVLVVIGRTTEWGRQFWRITGDYFKARQSLPVWVMLALLLLSTIASVRLTVLLSYQVNDIFTVTAVLLHRCQAGESAFWTIMVVFAVLATCYVVRLLLDLYLMQRFIMRWRIWLSHRFVDDWLGDFAYFRRQFARQPIDNPDQRIQQDIDVFTTGVGGAAEQPIVRLDHTLLFGAVEAVLSVFSFGAILWQLSGPLTIARRHAAPGAVLDRHRLRAHRHHHRVRHRQAPDPAELPERASQRGLPLRTGAGEGRERCHRPVPG